MPLSPRAPELNPVKNLWQFLHDNWLSNRIFENYDDILEHCCKAWNNLVDQPDRIPRSLVNHLDITEPEILGVLRQGVLKMLTLDVGLNLALRGLPDIDIGSALKMVRGEHPYAALVYGAAMV